MALQIVEGVKNSFRSFKTLDISFRRKQLENVSKMFKENEKKILDALYKDLHKVLS